METIIRLTASLGIFFIMISWEYFSPRRTQHISRKQRWPVNLGLAVFNMAGYALNSRRYCLPKRR